ncbi:MAG: zinc-dependent metalloprotease [Bacteroidia bacterium]|nr:zinc-dependent metalloprotease [Bacteroidia bacterium]
MNISAQELPCATQLSAKQIQDLRNFQQKISQNQVGALNKSTQFVPLKVHIIGNNQGLGYYSISNLMQALCEINQRFAPVGFHFYLVQNVSYINDDQLSLGNLDAIFDKVYDLKMPNAVNVFFHNSGNQWCGVYIPDVDVIFVKNSCQSPNATTLAHELGHFFNLPHTFYGWEGGSSFLEIEKVDGSNCRTAGDGFCDTKADYVSTRWACPLAYQLTDPNNVSFKPDSSFYMNYAFDACQSRFSQEQILTMQNDLRSRGVSKASALTSLLAAPNKITPANLDSGVSTKRVLFSWNAVPNAFAYHLQVARFGNWSFLNVDRLLSDTSIEIDLFGNWPFAWRIKAISEGNTCSEFGQADTFFTQEIAAGTHELVSTNAGFLYPNPVKRGEFLKLQNHELVRVTIYNSLGEIIFNQNYDATIGIEIPDWKAGLYYLECLSNNKRYVKRLMISEN